jgi:glycosyltransferase involved in cell wall biosynthesis
MRELVSDLVSVVVPVRNAERYLEAALTSVLAQSYPHIEIIAVDDGSDDRSVEILERYAGRVTLLRQPNRGAAAARNRGVRAARGEWIAFIDADDVWSPTKVQRQLEAIGRRSWCYTDSVFVGGVNDGRRDSELNEKCHGWVLEKLVCNNFVCTSSVLIKRQAYLDAGGFSEGFRYVEDWDLWIRVASAHEVAYVNEPLVEYRVHSASVSRVTRHTLPQHLKVIDRAFAVGSPAEGLRHLIPSAKARSYSICSQIAEEERDFYFGFRCSLLACGQQPLQAGLWIRALKASVKYLLSLIGKPLAQYYCWLAMLLDLWPAAFA